MQKAEVEEKSSENSHRIIKVETHISHQPSSDQIEKILKIISEEAMQLSEFLLQEEKLIRELCVILKQVLKQLNMSFNLSANIFPQAPKTQEIILNAEAHLIFIGNENEVKSKALEDYPPQVILNIASFIIPELGKSLTSYRKEVSSRIGIFDRINHELRNLRKILANRPKNLEEETNPVNNGAKKRLNQENRKNKESA